MADTQNPYLALLGSRLRSQLQYRASFTADLASSALLGILDLVEVLALYVNVPLLGGFDVTAALLVFSLASVSFALSDVVFGSLDEIPTVLRLGRLEVLLLRPLPLLAQLVLNDFALRRLGRCFLAVSVFAFAVPRLPIHWTAAHIALVLVTLISGTAIFGALFALAGAVQFFLLDGSEVVNALIYGSAYAARFPATALSAPVRALYGFVLPTVFVSFLPALLLLDRPGPAGVPAELGWASPLVAALSWLVAWAAWRIGVRHYRSGGG